MRHRMKGIVRDDSGIALLTVLGVIAVVTVLSVGSFYLATQTLHSSERLENETKAFRAANSGLDQQLATFTDDDVDSWPVEGVAGSTPDGTYVLTLEDLTGGEYRLTSTGRGIDGSEEAVAQQFFFMNLWEMNFAGTGPQSLITGGGTLTGSSNIIGPFYMKGTLDILSSMMVLEGPMFVRDGDIGYKAGMFGVSGAGNEVDVFCNGSIATLTGSKVFLGRTSTSVPDIQLPRIQQADLEFWAGKAKAESVDNVMGSVAATPTVTNMETDNTTLPTSYTTVQPPSSGTYARTKASNTNVNYKFIGAADGVIANKGSGSYPFTFSDATPSFGCWGPTNENTIVLTGHSSGAYATNVHDDFAWDTSTNTLYIEGTVFIDGDLTFDCDIKYVGNGTIVANGDVLIKGTMAPAGTSTPNARLNKWIIGIVTPTTINMTSNTPQVMGGNPTAQEVRDRVPDIGAALYAEQSVTTAAKLLVQGSVITGTINTGQNNLWLVTNPLLPTYLPESLPGAGGGLMMPGLWTRF